MGFWAAGFWRGRCADGRSGVSGWLGVGGLGVGGLSCGAFMALIQAPSDKHAKKSKTNACPHKHASDASRRVFTQGVPICLQAFLPCLEIGSQGFFASCEA